MGKRGDGYGSEDHLRRFLDTRRSTLNSAVAQAVGIAASDIEWLDYPKTKNGDREFERLEFLSGTSAEDVLPVWRDFWPVRGKAQTWDAIGRSGPTWLLVEAKATWPEFVTSSCGATGEGRRMIERALGRVKRDLGVNRWFDWTGAYYQHANRLAALWFLRQNRVPARLLGIYFIGDRFPDGTPCPATRREWEGLLEARRLTLGLGRRHKLSALEDDVFIDLR